MKRRITYSLLALLLAGSGVATAHADNPFEKLIPRGKLIKMITGEPAEEAAVQTQHIGQHRVPTPAGHAISQHRSHSHYTTPTRPLPPITSLNGHAASGSGSRGSAASVGNKRTASGFGMVLQQAKNGDLVVTRINPHGNAKLAGVSAGDVLRKIGGAAISSVDEFNQLTQGMHDGDHMEFELVHRGRKKQALVPFGNVDEVIATAINESSPSVVSGDKAAATASVEGVVGSDAGNQIRSVLTTPIQTGASNATNQTIDHVEQATEKGVRSLNEVIDTQRQRIKRMKEELKVLRQSNKPAISSKETVWKFPTLQKK